MKAAKIALMITGIIGVSTVARLKNVWKWKSFAREASHTWPTVPVSVILAVIARESGGNPDAVGDNGKAIGLMQMHRIAWDDVNENWPRQFEGNNYDDLKDDAQLQIYAGTAYLALLRQRANGNLLLALDGFNRGLSKASIGSEYAIDVMVMAAVQFVIDGFV